MDGKELLAGLEAIAGAENIVLLSSPCMTHGCVDGKIAFIEREMPTYSRRYFIGPPKHMMASPAKILIDDNNENVLKFSQAGGKAVLVPRPWNASSHLVNHATNSYDVDLLLSNVKQSWENA